jgi:hypothetical protein
VSFNAVRVQFHLAASPGCVLPRWYAIDSDPDLAIGDRYTRGSFRVEGYLEMYRASHGDEVFLKAQSIDVQLTQAELLSSPCGLVSAPRDKYGSEISSRESDATYDERDQEIVETHGRCPFAVRKAPKH